jgi:hypothetical protein
MCARAQAQREMASRHMALHSVPSQPENKQQKQEQKEHETLHYLQRVRVQTEHFRSRRL